MLICWVLTKDGARNIFAAMGMFGYATQLRRKGFETWTDGDEKKPNCLSFQAWLITTSTWH